MHDFQLIISRSISSKTKEDQTSHAQAIHLSPLAPELDSIVIIVLHRNPTRRRATGFGPLRRWTILLRSRSLPSSTSLTLRAHSLARRCIHPRTAARGPGGAGEVVWEERAHFLCFLVFEDGILHATAEARRVVVAVVVGCWGLGLCLGLRSSGAF
jgi:hypothetical protein